MPIEPLKLLLAFLTNAPAPTEPGEPTKPREFLGPDAVAADERPAASADTSNPAEAPSPVTAQARQPTQVKHSGGTVERRVEIEGAPGRGVTFSFGNKFSLNLKARIQIRYQLAIPREDDDGVRELEQLVGIGTARLWLSGHMFKPAFTYMIQLAVAPRDFRDGSISPIYDAYVDWKAHRDVAIRAGQFFVPFDRLRTVREFALQMPDRPRPVLEMTLDRDVGAMLYSDRFLHDRSPVAYRVGVFGGGGNNLAVAKQPGALVVGRLELRPLGPIDDDHEGDHERRRKPGLALGGGFAANFDTNRLRSTTGPTFEGGETHYYHAAADLVFKWWGLAIEGEYLWRRASTDTIDSLMDDGTPLTEYTRSGQGWIAQLSYTFAPPIEIVGRLSAMYARGGTDPAFMTEVEERGQEVGAGLNYYVNGHRFKVQAGWIARMPRDFAFGGADHSVTVLLDATF